MTIDVARLDIKAIEPRSPHRRAIAGSSAIALSWLYLNGSALQWMGQAARELSSLNGLMLAAGGLLLIVQAARQQRFLQISLAPTLRSAPLALMLACGLGAIAWQWLLSLEQISVLLFVLGTYGWLGLHLAPIAWQRGLVVAVAIACILPFGVQFSTGLGFPTRILTAHAVELILNHLHIAALSSEDIIVLDTGLARVELPCSGLKSLWTGSLFLLAATWLEGRQLGGRWLLVCAANLALLVMANIARVLTLVVLLHVFKQPAIAAMLHVPLGILSFVTVCAIAWLLLRWVPRHRSRDRECVSTAEKPICPKSTRIGGSRGLFQISEQRTLIASAAIALCLLLLTLVPRPPAIALSSIDLARVHLPAAIQTEAIALNPFEQDFFANYSNVAVQKQRFQFQGLAGDLLLVGSTTWEAQHSPELCLISSGFEVSRMEQQQLAPQVVGRWMAINGDRQSAAYWFQSAKRTTDNFLTRIWGEVSRQDSAWVMVSILFDRSLTSDQPEVQAFADSVYRAIEPALRSKG